MLEIDVMAFAVSVVLGLVASWQFSSLISSPTQDLEDLKSKPEELDVLPLDWEPLIVKIKNVLLILSEADETMNKDFVIKDFCGTVVTEDFCGSFDGKTVFLSGDITRANNMNLTSAEKVCIIKELSHSYDNFLSRWSLVDLGRVPILVEGVGVYYRRFFSAERDSFNRIRAEHVFQNLTESNKPGTAHRTGIYLTSVEQEQNSEDLRFHLLRCSSNLSGPTGNFGPTDRDIVTSLNAAADTIFQNHAPLNHVLAQIYHNTERNGNKKETKAKIKAHADKTKDMPRNHIMAFVTFYDKLHKLKPLKGNNFDYGHKNTSGLTKLLFRLKDPVAASAAHVHLVPKFSVTLYPDSVFMIPTSTNRLYTHEIVPSSLDAKLLPTRMGYVVRCSSTEAVYRNHNTCLQTAGDYAPLVPPTSEGMAKLRELYALENSSVDYIHYGHFPFSMNKGDYEKPKVIEEFRWLDMSPCIDNNLFEELEQSAVFELLGKGRTGTVLLSPDQSSRVPIVRTTTKYAAPAQCFQPVHKALALHVQKCAGVSIAFNNALIESYTNAYTTMGYHSDQALDLHDHSDIAVYSCYKYPDLVQSSLRKLVVESKETGEVFEVPLMHNSVVVWSLATNRKFKHKIILEPSAHAQDNEWLGVTMRTSKTFLHHHEGSAVLEEGSAALEEGSAVLGASMCFDDGTHLSLADTEQARQFYSFRRKENEQIDFTYPPVTYTISASDMMLPAKLPLPVSRD